VAVVASAADSARIGAALRARGFEGTVYGGPTMGRRRFVALAGAAAEGVISPLLFHADASETSRAFARSFETRFDMRPDYMAAYAYDAVRLLIEAIGETGLDRTQIRDAVLALSPWSGVAGLIQWDPHGRNHRTVPLGTVRQGRLTPLTESE